MLFFVFFFSQTLSFNVFLTGNQGGDLLLIKQRAIRILSFLVFHKNIHCKTGFVTGKKNSKKRFPIWPSPNVRNKCFDYISLIVSFHELPYLFYRIRSLKSSINNECIEVVFLKLSPVTHISKICLTST